MLPIEIPDTEHKTAPGRKSEQPTLLFRQDREQCKMLNVEWQSLHYADNTERHDGLDFRVTSRPPWSQVHDEGSNF